MRLWDLTSGRQSASLSEPSCIPAAALSPDGRTFAAGCFDGTPVIADVATGQRIRTCSGTKQLIDSLVFGLDGKLLIGTGWIVPPIRLWDPATGKELPPLGILPGGEGHGPKCLAVSSDGKYLATGGMDRIVRLWDLAARKEVRQFLGQEGSIWSVAFSPDSKSIAAVTAVGKHIFGANGTDRNIRLWEVATGRLRQKFVGPAEGSWSVTWSPDGRTVATGGEDNLIRLWEVTSAQERARLAGHQGPVTTLAFLPSGKQLISGSSDTTALVWDLTCALPAGNSRGKLPAKDLDRLWTDLAGADAQIAYSAIWSLYSKPEQAVALLKERLRPATAPGLERLARLIGDLDSNRFAVRRKAEADLERLGDLAESALRAGLQRQPSLEFRQRAESLLRKLEEPITAPTTLRGLRSIEVLEHIGTPEARQVVETLAKGAAEARLTQEAEASLKRLAKRASSR